MPLPIVVGVEGSSWCGCDKEDAGEGDVRLCACVYMACVYEFVKMRVRVSSTPELQYSGALRRGEGNDDMMKLMVPMQQQLGDKLGVLGYGNRGCSGVYKVGVRKILVEKRSHGRETGERLQEWKKEGCECVRECKQLA